MPLTFPAASGHPEPTQNGSEISVRRAAGQFLGGPQDLNELTNQLEPKAAKLSAGIGGFAVEQFQRVDEQLLIVPELGGDGGGDHRDVHVVFGSQ